MGANPAQLFITVGAEVSHEGRDYVITALVDLSLVLARDKLSGEKVVLKIGALGPATPVEGSQDAPLRERNIETVTEEEWEVAESRKAAITPLLDSFRKHQGALAAKIAREYGVSAPSVYRWAQRFRETGLLSSLLDNAKLRGGKGGSRLQPEVDAIIRQTIEDFHDTEQKPSVAATILEIRRRCDVAKLPLPAGNSIRARIHATAGYARTEKRHGKEVAHTRHVPHKQDDDMGRWPLDKVEIDHTKLPVIIVDDENRRPINRAWITLAIDTWSRVCLGMYLSLDGPSAMSTGMCIVHTILPKDKWLQRLDVTSMDWPAWGIPGRFQFDNAKEFRGKMLHRALKEYNSDLFLRPCGVPRYGAHIERLMGTVSTGLKTLKGATFSGPSEKGVYDAEGNACMTFSELERWLVLFFGRYHLSPHAGIKAAPLNRWRHGLLGDSKTKGRGIPVRRLDEEKLRIHFMPFVERTVQQYGVLIDNVHYFHDVLRPWINAPHPDFPRHHRTFRFHRDPRDISQLYFFDEIAGRYFAIPYRDSSLPPVSQWELRDAQKRAAERGIAEDNEKLIFALITEQRELESTAAEKTKAARRAVQRRKQHEKTRKERREDLPTIRDVKPSEPPPAVRGYDPDAIKPLDDD